MGNPISSYQIGKLQQAWVGALNFTANGADDVATTAITTALNTAGDGGSSVPLQVSSATQGGVIVTSPDNYVRIALNSNKMPVADSNNNQVYGRITHSAGVYTISYFSLVNGTETAYTFSSNTAIDFYFPYLFEFGAFPRNALTRLTGALIQDDPLVAGGGGSTVRTPQLLTVTALNTLSALSNAPSAAGNVILYVNGKAEFATGGAPSFSVSGTTITWSSVNAKYDIQTSFEVYAVVW